MSFKEKFLQMEIGQQIKVTILATSILSTIFLVLIIFCYSYEVIDQSIRLTQQYFFDMKEETIVSITYFQNINLLLYEEIVKLLTHQIFNYFQSKKFLITEQIFNKTYIDSFIYPYDNSIEGNHLFFYYFQNSNMTEDKENFIKNNLAKLFPIITTIQNIKPVLLNGLQFMSEFVIIDTQYQFIFSMNKTKIKNILIEVSNESFYENLVEYHKTKNFYFFNLVIKNVYSYMEMFFPSLMSKIEKYYDKEKKEFLVNYQEEIFSNLSKHEPIINYDKAQISLIDNLNISNINMIIINNLIYGYLDKLFISLYFNTNQFLAIPVDENNYLKTKTTCFLFLIFQKLLYTRVLSNEEYYSLFNQIYEDKLNTIYDCLINVDIDHIKDLLQNKTIPNFFYSEKKISKLFNISGYELHEIIKYISPSFNGLYYFKPKYMFDNYFIIYLFVNYAPVIKNTNDYKQILFNCLLGIVLYCFMFWIFVILFLLYIEKKLSKDVTFPIIKLRQSIETMNLNDIKLFEYNEDDTINELFQTCKELLKGEIILKKKYNKDEELNYKNNTNLIIDNKMISELILNDNLDRVEQDNIKYFEQYKFRRVLENKKKKITHDIRKDFGSRKDSFFLSQFYNTLKKKKDHISNTNEYQIDMEDLNIYNNLFELSEIVFDKKYVVNKNESNETIMYKTRKKDDDEEEIKIQNKKSVLYHWFMNTKKKRNGNIFANKKKKTLIFLRKDNFLKNKITYEQKLEKLKYNLNEFRQNLVFTNSMDEINTSSTKYNS